MSRRGALALAICALALAICALAAAGCGEPRSGAVSEIGPCAQVIPLARAHLPRPAKLVSVRALKRGGLRPLLSALNVQAPPHPRRHRAHRLPRKGCVMVYRGTFAAGGEITGAARGRYLVLVISVRHPRLLRGVVVDRLPAAVKAG
jgi:hypothetical protein